MYAIQNAGVYMIFFFKEVSPWLHFFFIKNRNIVKYYYNLIFFYFNTFQNIIYSSDGKAEFLLNQYNTIVT